jgi:hypothetical protein
MQIDSEEVTAESIRMVALRSPRYSRERDLQQLLGEIKNVSVVKFENFFFLSRVTTNKMVLKITTGLNKDRLIQDANDYDPWSLKWFDHASRIVGLQILKQEVDGGDLYEAQISKLMREIRLNEDSSTHRLTQETLKKAMFGDEEEEMIYKPVNF